DAFMKWPSKWLNLRDTACYSCYRPLLTVGYCVRISVIRRYMLKDKCGPFTVYMGEDRDLKTEFLTDLRAALDLIRTVDDRRYRRCCHEIEIFAELPGIGIAAYQRPGRMMMVDYSQYLEMEGDYEWRLTYFAATIIHEATHGRLESRGFRYPVNRRMY